MGNLLSRNKLSSDGAGQNSLQNDAKHTASVPIPGDCGPGACKNYGRKERIHIGDLAGIQLRGGKPNIVITGKADEYKRRSRADGMPEVVA